MSEVCKELWVDKYRPKKLSEYLLDDDLKTYFKNMIKNNAMQSMTFIQTQGSGKTTLAKILCNEFDAEVLFVKCATEGTIDTLRSKVEPFCNARSIEGKLKIVVLDEIDSASSSGDNNFQKGLRTLIEAAQDDTRFILTANMEKVMAAILSRCPIIPLSFGMKDLLKHVKKILDAEKITYTKESLKQFVQESFKYCPDCRRIINYLQFCCNTGELVVKFNIVASSGKEEFISSVVKQTLECKNILDVRKFYLQNKAKLSDFIEGGSLLFNYVVDNNIIDDAQAILKLTDMLYQLNVVVDKEPTFFGMLVVIQTYGKRS